MTRCCVKRCIKRRAKKKSVRLSMTAQPRALHQISNHPELHPARFTDHVLVPRWIPNEIDLSFVNTIDAEDFTLRIMRDRGSHSTARRRQRHFYFDLRAAFRLLHQLTIVNQTEIDDVDWNFGIETLPQLIPDSLFI